MKDIKRHRLFLGIGTTVILLTVIALFVAILIRQRQNEDINKALRVLQDSEQPVRQVTNALESFSLAGNEFLEYTLTYNETYFNSYRKDIETLIAHVDTLKQMTLPMTMGTKHRQNVLIAIQEQRKEAAIYSGLTRLTDSLLVEISDFDSIASKDSEKQLLQKALRTKRNIPIDTNAINIEKKEGIFGKIKTFLVGKGESAREQRSIRHPILPAVDTTKSSPKIGEIPQTADKKIASYQAQLKRYFEAKKEKRQSELRLIRLNLSLLDKIKAVLNNMQHVVEADDARSMDSSSKAIIRSSTILHNTLLYAIVALLILALTIVYMLHKVYVNNLAIKESARKAIEDATEKNRFLAYMSHEFRSPLSLVMGYIEQLEKTGLASKQQKYLTNLKASSEMLLTTVNDILDLSRLQAGKMEFLAEPFDPRRAVKKVAMTFENVAKEKKLQLAYTHDKSRAMVIGDEIRLRQVVSNLLNNAVKYTREGSINISSSSLSAEGKVFFELKVTDTGIGIAEEKIGQVFDEYQQVHDQTSQNRTIGTGLGLSITKRLLENMGGTIHVKSEINKGTEFTVWIPFVPFSGTPEKKKRLKRNAAQIPDRLRILVVDDNYFSVSLLKAIFKHTNATIDFVENGQEALSKLETQSYNLLLSDLYMPVMNGIELTRKVRNHSQDSVRNVVIIILSGNSSPDMTRHLIEAGINDYLLKPFHQDDLFELINKHLG